MAPPIQGTVDLSGGQRTRFTYYFNRNALSDGVLSGGSLFALTDSGNLLRFNIETLELTGQTVVPGRATTIAQDLQGDVLTGTQEGNIYEVDRSSLGLKRIVSTEGRVTWLGVGKSAADRNGRIVAVVNNNPNILPWPGEARKAFEARTRAAYLRKRNPNSVVIYENGKTRFVRFSLAVKFPFPERFELDSQNRLWMGVDKGEWGGECAYIDLSTGAFHELSTQMDGVLGFARTADERAIVYGGMSHLGMNTGYIAKLKDDGLNFLVKVEHNDWPAPPNKLPEAVAQAAAAAAAHADTMPKGPIDLVLTDGAVRGFWVVSGQTLYHADDQFKQWEKIVDLGGRWEGGRRFSVGNTPTVNQLIVDPQHRGSFVAIMGLDGLRRVKDGRVEALPFAGELEDPVIEIWNTSIGTALLGPDDRGGNSPWLLRGGQWHRYSIFPDQPPSDDAEWYFAEPFGNDGARISAFEHGNISPAKAFMVQLSEDGTANAIDSWEGDSSEFDTAFLTASDGTVLRASDDELSVRQQGVWKEVGRSQLAWPVDQMSVMNARRMILVGSANRFDYFLDAKIGDLYRLRRPGKPGGEYSLTRATYQDHAMPAGIFDAVPERDGRALFSTSHGLLQFDLASGLSKVIPNPNSSEGIKSLCRDTQGRLWAAGDSLYISSDEGKHWNQAKLPMLTRTYTKRIRPDPANPRHMILTLEDMGAVVLDWPE